METKHTKGEWCINHRLIIQVQPNSLETMSICQVYGNDEESKANAKLIANAPTMLEALEKSYIALTNAINATKSGELRNLLTEANILALSAIKKATE